MNTNDCCFGKEHSRNSKDSTASFIRRNCSKVPLSTFVLVVTNTVVEEFILHVKKGRKKVDLPVDRTPVERKRSSSSAAALLRNAAANACMVTVHGC